MKEYHTTPSNKKYGIDNLPTEDMRLLDEEIKSAPEWERESMTTDQSKSSKKKVEEEEFDFENSRSTKEKTGASSDKEDHNAITSEQDVSSYSD